MTTLTVSLRAATEADRGLLLEVYSQTRAAELVRVPWSAPEKTAFCVQQFVAQETAYRAQWPSGRFLVVEVAGEPVGRLYLAHAPAEIRLIDIALLPEFRDRGIGTLLLRQVLAEAESLGLPVVLHVELGNAARRLYERLGFVETGRSDLRVRMERRPGSLS